ncbi:MAG TPA: YlqF/YawG family GTPase [Limnochordales bacterium]
MELHWYPGHMAKAARELKAHLRLVDAVVEVIDARIPFSSRHPTPIGEGRPLLRVLLLSRADLADPEWTRAWIRHFSAQGLAAVAADLRRRDWVPRLKRLLLAGGRPRQERQGLSAGPDRAPAPARPLRAGPAAAPGRGPRVRVLVAGLPNVGKSTAINALAGRAKAGTGALAGVTRRVQWLAAGEGLELLDSPGLLWPEATRGRRALHLAVAGFVPDDAFDVRAVAEEFLAELAERFPERLVQRYGPECRGAGDAMLGAVAQRMGLWLPGGRPDLDRAAAVVLQDFRSGRLGRLTLETPAEG